MADQPEIIVRTGGQNLKGWLQSQVSRSIENVAGTFVVPVDLVPGQQPPVKRQDDVEIIVGSTVVIRGYVVAAGAFYRREQVGFRVVGRDRTGDLARCSAIHKGGQWRSATVERIARDLAEPLGVQVVVAPGVSIGAALADFKLSLGESCVDAISRAAKLRGILVTTDGAGNLLLTKAGQRKAPGEIRRGVNVIAMEDIGSDEHRYSDYVAYAQSNVAGDWDAARQVKAVGKDTEIRRRATLLISPDGNLAQADLQALVDHTARVRRGHAYGFRYTVEGWLVGGEPWPVNALVRVYDDIAGLNGEEWLICSAELTVDRENAAVTVLVIRPREAYDTVPLKTKLRRRKADRDRGRDGARLEGRKP